MAKTTCFNFRQAYHNQRLSLDQLNALCVLDVANFEERTLSVRGQLLHQHSIVYRTSDDRAVSLRQHGFLVYMLDDPELMHVLSDRIYFLCTTFAHIMTMLPIISVLKFYSY